MARKAKKPDEPQTASETLGETISGGPQDTPPGGNDTPQGDDALPNDGDADVVDTPEQDGPTHAKQPTRLTQMPHAVMIWHHVAQIGEDPTLFAHPQSWAHVASQLQIGHEIVVVAAEGTWRLHLYVRAVGRNEAHVGPIHFAEFGKAPELADDVPYGVSWRGPHIKWCVVSKETGAVIKDSFQTEEMAGAWVSQHLKAMAA